MTKKTFVFQCNSGDDAANGADGERLDSLVKTDWNAVRTLALNCLDAVGDLKSWADGSQRGYYNEACAAMHLAAIKKAEDVFSQSLTAFISAGGDTVFEQIAAASVGEGPRPDFGFTATAHESSLVLLGFAVREVNIGLGDALVSIGARDFYNGAIQDLHLCSPKQLRDALHHSEKSKPLQPLFDRCQPLIKIRAWIDREWAAAISNTVIETPKRSPNQLTEEEKVGRILDRLKLHAESRGETKRRHSQYLNAKANNLEWSIAYKVAKAQFDKASKRK